MMPMNIRVPLRTAVAAITFAIAAGAANAATFTTTLSGENERPTPVVTGGSGTGTLLLAADRNSFSVDIDFTGLSANAVAGHVHIGPITGTGPVAVGFTVPAATAGTITGTFDLLLQSTYSAGFFNGLGGGTVDGARSAFLSGLDAGNAYFNVHTSINPGGEIRGQLGLVPEPGSWAMMIAGFGLVGTAMRRRDAVTTHA